MQTGWNVRRCRLLCPISFDHHTLPNPRFNNQISENCGRTISQQKRTTYKERENRPEDLYCYRVSIYNGLAATQYLVVGVLLFIRQNSDMVLWISLNFFYLLYLFFISTDNITSDETNL